MMIPGNQGAVFSNSDSKALMSALSSRGGDLTINLHGTGDVLRDLSGVASLAGVMRRVETTR